MLMVFETVCSSADSNVTTRRGLFAGLLALRTTRRRRLGKHECCAKRGAMLGLKAAQGSQSSRDVI